jgi:hypothetical protein
LPEGRLSGSLPMGFGSTSNNVNTS